MTQAPVQQEPRSDQEWQRLPEIRAKFLDYVDAPTDENALRIIAACRDRVLAAAPVQAVEPVRMLTEREVRALMNECIGTSPRDLPAAIQRAFIRVNAGRTIPKE
jgi:hypothetical protein